MTTPITPGDARQGDTVLPITGKVGVTRLPAIDLDANTTTLRVEVDPSTMTDPAVFVTLAVEFSPDQGQTWTRLCESGHWGGCEVFEDATDQKGQPIINQKTGKPARRASRDESGTVIRVAGLPSDSAGNPLEFSIEQRVDLGGVVGIPMFRPVVTASGGPLNTTARARKT